MAKRKKLKIRKGKERKKINKKGIIILSILLVLFILSLIFDNQIFRFIQETRIKTGLNLKSDFIESYFFYAVVFVISLILIIVDNKIKNKKSQIFHFIIGLISAVLLTIILKWIVARPRPIPSYGKLLIDEKSFPSGHSTVVFSLIPFLKNKAFLITWLIISILIAILRVWQGAHYPSDVVAGAIIGYIVPIITTRILKRKR
jgi:membrane-associated phospholipid phosphatase